MRKAVGGMRKVVGGVRKVVGGVRKVVCFPKTTPAFGVDGSSGDLLIFPGLRRLASGERLRY